MLRRIEPEVGCWYEDCERDCLFEVVSIDEDSVAVQYFEGEIEDYELEAFLRLPLVAVEQPEDWSGPYEVENEDQDDFEFTPPQEDASYRFDGYDNSNMQLIDEL